MMTSIKLARVLFGAARALGVLLLGVAALAGIETAYAQGTPDQVLFGPKQYVRMLGAPNEYSDAFSVPAAIGAPFLLRIVNGSANGTNRIHFARIKINGVQVAGPADFGQNVAMIERTVTLVPNNSLEVSLAGGPDGSLTLVVLGTRILPAPTALSPNPLAITTGASGNLTATLAPVPTSAGTLTVSS